MQYDMQVCKFSSGVALEVRQAFLYYTKPPRIALKIARTFILSHSSRVRESCCSNTKM